MYRNANVSGQFTRHEARRLSSAFLPAPVSRLPEAPVRPLHLVVVNGDENRMGAVLGVAGQLAVRAGASVHAAYLHTPPAAGDLSNIRLLAAATWGGPEAEVRGRLLRASLELGSRTGEMAFQKLLVGQVNSTLPEYVQANQFELVTLGTGGSSLRLWSRGLWTEVAKWRPALIVGPNVRSNWSDGPNAGGEVVVVLDGTTSAETILAPAASLCRSIDARMTLLGVTRSEDRASRGACHRYLMDIAQRVRDNVPTVRLVVAEGRPAEAVLSVQKATNAIIAVTSPVWSWLSAFTPGRAAARLVRQSTSPVLLYRPSKKQFPADARRAKRRI